MNQHVYTAGMRAILISLAFTVLAGTACSLFATYDLDGLPCDPTARRGEECIPDAGYECVRADGGAGVCTKRK